MTYDFTTLPDRWDTGAEKYELMKKRCPDVPGEPCPFPWRTMDFLPPPGAERGRARTLCGARVFGYTRTPREYIAAFQRWMQRRTAWTSAAWVVDADSVLGAMTDARAFTGRETASWC